MKDPDRLTAFEAELARAPRARDVPLHRLGLSPKDDSGLRWMLTREHEGRMGYRSSQGGFYDQMMLRALMKPPENPWACMAVGHVHDSHKADHDLEQRTADVAEQERPLHGRWRRLGGLDQNVLAATLGPDTYPGLDAFESPLTGEPLGNVVLVAPGARRAHRDARGEAPTDEEHLAWLQNLSARWMLARQELDGQPKRKRKSGAAPSSIDRHQRRHDAALVAAIVEEADALLLRAMRSFESTRPPRPKVPRAA